MSQLPQQSDLVSHERRAIPLCNKVVPHSYYSFGCRDNRGKQIIFPYRPESTPSSELAHIIKLSYHQAPSPPIGELEFIAWRACSWISRLIKYFTGGQHLWQRLDVTAKPNTKAGSESGVISVTGTPGYLFLPER